MRKPILCIFILFITIIVLSLVQVIVSNRLTTTGIELSKIQIQIADLKRENTVLSEKLLVVSSYDTIASQAATLGFVESKKQLFLSAPQPMALKR
jgi:cell division protein FtsL